MKIASIGGSATWGMRFPEDLNTKEAASVVWWTGGFETPWGKTGPMKFLMIEGVPVVRVPVHGWRMPMPSIDDSLPVFWVLRELGVEQVVVDASVGGISSGDGELVEPWTVVVADDFVDVHHKTEVAKFAEEIGVGPWRRMGQSFCPRLRKALIESTMDLLAGQRGQDIVNPFPKNLLHEGVYYTTPLGPFETAAEIEIYRQAGATIIGQSTGPEAMLARVCEMCFGGIYIAANYAEGMAAQWVEEGMKEFYTKCAHPMGLIVIWALRKLVKQERECDCAQIASQVDLSGLPVPGA